MRIPNPTGRTFLSHHIHSGNFKDGNGWGETYVLPFIIVCCLFNGFNLFMPTVAINHRFHSHPSQTLSFINLNQFTYV
ncbi:MAG: hypothetical protein CMH46_10210 [Muricauda sp.]|nr:hypothetical protein [Allomuricauda sp.]